MRAMILAAGRGTRMGDLTDHQPKPLLEVGGMALIEYHVRALASAGFYEIVINVSYLADQVISYLGTGERFGVSIEYSNEQPQPLETAGGIANALPLLGDRPFLVINSDIWSDYPLSRLQQGIGSMSAHLVLVPNPVHHPQGDFGLEQQKVTTPNGTRYTFSGIGVYQPEFFEEVEGAFPLAPLLHKAIAHKTISGQLFDGYWWDVGTPARAEQVDAFIRGITAQTSD